MVQMMVQKNTSCWHRLLIEITNNSADDGLEEYFMLTNRLLIEITNHNTVQMKGLWRDVVLGSEFNW